MAVCAALWLPAQLLHASPYASCITLTNKGAGVTNVQFYLNEGAVTYRTTGNNAATLGNAVTNPVTVIVTFEDGTSNDVFNGLTLASTNVDRGFHSFALTNTASPGVKHTGYSISVFKVGIGVPSQVSLDTPVNGDTLTNYGYYNVPRGLAVNANPKVGSLFGRLYVANDNAQPSKGIYALNSDFSLITSNTALGIGNFTNGGTSGPWKLRVAPDNSLIVGDFSTANASLWLFSPDLTSSNLLLGPIGQTAAAAAGFHGDMFGTAQLTGSLAQSNLTLWVADSGMQVPSLTVDPKLVLGPGTTPGMYNNLFRFDIGAGPLPYTNTPNYAFNYGLDVIGELTVESDVAPDGKVFTGFGRSNLSNPILHVLSFASTNDPGTLLWNSWVDTGGNGDPYRGDTIGSTVQYPYSGIRVSPDDAYYAQSGYQNYLTLVKLTNGIPDDNTLFTITNNTTSNTGRGGMGWDSADNIYQVNGNTVELRSWSLGNTLTCITSNDITGTNGSFVTIAPPVTATATTTTQNGSQNYGSPTPGVINIALTTNVLSVPVTVAFSLSGSASYPLNYTLNLGLTNGILVSSNSVTFPAGTSPSGNWNVNLLLTPTATPASGPALTAILLIQGGAAYSASGSSAKANVTIVNTGPQLLILSTLASGTTMSRAITNDYVKFVITRWGDVSVPTYTVTNINYFGTANYPADYTAQAQRYITGSLLSDGSPGIQINPNEVLITNAIGNPLMRPNLNVPPQNVTIALSLTNALTGTNVTSAEGYSYVVTATNAITLTEVDNAYGDRVVLWSNPLTNVNDSVNWTLTYASEKLGPITQLPVVVPNYTNNETSYLNGGTNDFDVEFGYGLPNTIPASPAMLAHGWTNVLEMTVNKGGGQTPTAVNLYPQGTKFFGNYALRFSMYLSAQNNAIGNIYAGASAREYALFGINHTGTNCNWRPSIGAPTGFSGTTNSDGEWFAIDEADQAATPADFDAFTPPGLPNSGVTADFVSNAGSALRGIFKNPPFLDTQNPLGGEPVNAWADVSVEVTKQTNCTIYVDGAQVLTPFSIGISNSTSLNKAPMTNGTVMLGYLDPDASQGDSGSQFVYYSNIRVVELSPYISAQATNLIVTNGANISFTATAIYGSAGVTNSWYLAPNPTTPLTLLQTDTTAATNLTSSLFLNNVQAGTNYLAVFSDLAGSVTSVVAQVEVITGPTNRTVFAGSNFVQFVAIPSGPANPTIYQWKTNGVNISNGTHYAGVTTNVLTITNVELVDAVAYTCAITNSAGGLVTAPATLTVIGSSPTFSGISIVGPSTFLSFTTTNGYDNTSSYTLVASTNVTGPYAPVSATNTGSAGSFQFQLPKGTNATMFYRLLHN